MTERKSAKIQDTDKAHHAQAHKATNGQSVTAISKLLRNTSGSRYLPRVLSQSLAGPTICEGRLSSAFWLMRSTQLFHASLIPLFPSKAIQSGISEESQLFLPKTTWTLP
jgi:hypothetical protein